MMAGEIYGERGGRDRERPRRLGDRKFHETATADCFGPRQCDEVALGPVRPLGHRVGETVEFAGRWRREESFAEQIATLGDFG
jgi:hypothetical protein